MKNVMLISSEDVKKDAYVQANVLPHTIDVTIRRVQRTMLKKVMGKTAYNDLIDKVSASLPPTVPIVPLTTETKTLLEDYVQPYLCAAVDYKILLPLTIESKSTGAGKNKDENFDTAQLNELIRLRDQYKQDTAAYAEDLQEYLEEECEENEAKSSKRTTPWNSIKFR